MGDSKVTDLAMRKQPVLRNNGKGECGPQGDGGRTVELCVKSMDFRTVNV